MACGPSFASLGTSMRASSSRKSSCQAVDACQAGCGRGARRDVPTALSRLFADTLPQELVGLVEIREEAAEECIAVGGHRFSILASAVPFRFDADPAAHVDV